MSKAYEKIEKCYKAIRERVDFEPEVALILGSGLGEFAETIRQVASVPYSEIEGFPVSTVSGHNGRFVFGYVGDVKVVIMQGRVHYYEGYSVFDVVLPTRIMAKLGAKVLFLTNAAGGANPTLNAGDFMLIRDHIMSFFPNPLIGENIDELGDRFIDMSKVYDEKLQNTIRSAASSANIPLREGVYVQLTGPSFETPSEVRMLHGLGADAVGMSTACEATAARHAGMKICGVSCITNKGAGISATPLSHEEVKETADRVAPLFRRLVHDSIVAFKETGCLS